MTDNRLEQGNDWLDDFIPYHIYRISNHLSQLLRTRLRYQQMSLSRWRVLSLLRARGTLTINEIAEGTAMEQPTVSRTVTRLNRDGLVSRRAAEQDSRFMEVSLTADGTAAFETIFPVAVAHQTAALRGFSDSERAALQDYLQRIQRNIDAESAAQAMRD